MEKPTQGGVYIRDPETGRLSAVPPDPADNPPSPDAPQSQPPEVEQVTSPAHAGLVASEPQKNVSTKR